MSEEDKPSEPLKNPGSQMEEIENEEIIFKPQNGLPFPTEVDLNEIFPDSGKDLNELFPDEEIKLLLKKMQKNKKDMRAMADRFLDKDWTSDVTEVAAEESTSADPSELQPQEKQAG